ncbi:MAG: hypothetical protein ABSF26_10560 [Thermoguttaceae bacterium]|jgi:hypothetical protein
MSKLLRGLTACGLVLLLTGVAQPGVLIVDGKNPRADDKNAGTLESPLETIQAAADKAGPGDTVQVRAGMVTAPKGARRFKLGFGLRNCSGWAAFSDIDIKTRPGALQVEVKQAPPIDPSRFAWTVCDLTTLLNRPLADDVDNDGKGGWTDQGPAMDLRNLYAGDYAFGGVAFRVAPGNACFVMKNKYRPSQNLPEGGAVSWSTESCAL